MIPFPSAASKPLEMFVPAPSEGKGTHCSGNLHPEQNRAFPTVAAGEWSCAPWKTTWIDPGAPGMQALPGFMGFRSPAGAVGTSRAPRGSTVPSWLHPAWISWKTGSTPHPPPLENHRAFGSQEKRSPSSLFLPLGWGENEDFAAGESKTF